MDKIGRFLIEEELGSGGMGTVYKARDPVFNRSVAIKVLHPHLARRPDVLERFKAEAVIQARLEEHPSVVTVHEFLTEGEPAMVMKFISGSTIHGLIQQHGGPVPYEKCVEIYSQLLSAVGFAHEQGLVHRDLKPSNVMVSETGGRLTVTVMDFGVAKVLGTEKDLTAAKAKMGTLCYSAPEQIRSPKDVDHRADIYSLGCTLYEMVTGEVPFDAETEYELMEAIIKEPPRSPTELHSGVSPKLAEVILKSLAKDPDQRFASCEEFLDALELAGSPPEPEPPPKEEKPPPPEPTPPVPIPPPRPRLWLLGAGVVIAALVVIVIWMASQQRGQQDVLPSPPVELGELLVFTDPAAYASLEGGFLDPAGGRRLSTRHHFTDLEPRSYLLEVWREGYKPETHSVPISRGPQPTEIEINLVEALTPEERDP